MPWLQLTDPATGTRFDVHVKMPKPRPRKCAHCGDRAAYWLCDGPAPATAAALPFEGQAAPAARSCDAPICRRCAIRVGPDRDFCRRPACLAAARAAAAALRAKPQAREGA